MSVGDGAIVGVSFCKEFVNPNILDEGDWDCLPSTIPETKRKTPINSIKGFTITRSVEDS
jgi:hypothetical protein